MTTSNAFSDLLTALEVSRVKPNRPADMRAAALYYARVLKWPVFPLKPRGKTPLTEHGFQDATLDLERVEAWWTTTPDANIGLPTGPAAIGGIGLDVIDADGPEGVQAWQELKHRLCGPDCSKEAFCDATGGFDVRAECFTPGNAEVGRGPGRHVFVPASGMGNTVRIGDKPLDIRGAGGYVVAAPSVNFLGASYVWLKAPSAPSSDIAPDSEGAA